MTAKDPSHIIEKLAVKVMANSPLPVKFKDPAPSEGCDKCGKTTDKMLCFARPKPNHYCLDCAKEIREMKEKQDPLCVKNMDELSKAIDGASPRDTIIFNEKQDPAPTWRKVPAGYWVNEIHADGNDNEIIEIPESLEKQIKQCARDDERKRIEREQYTIMKRNLFDRDKLAIKLSQWWQEQSGERR